MTLSFTGVLLYGKHLMSVPICFFGKYLVEWTTPSPEMMTKITTTSLSIFASLSCSGDTCSTLAADPYSKALVTIPIALFLAYIPHFMKVNAMIPLQGLSYNHVSPRTTDLTSKKANLPGWIARARGAHQNSLECFPFFAISVLVAKVQGVDPELLAVLGFSYIVQRILFIAVYICAFNNLLGFVRTAIWSASFITCFKIIFSAL